MSLVQRPLPGLAARDHVVVGDLETKHGLHWWTVRCPYCGRVHRHAAGLLGHDPKRALGWKPAPCNGGRYFVARRQ
jgi:hypothetical protein